MRLQASTLISWRTTRARNWTYFPAVPEVLITVGIVALELMAYLYIVKRYPILGGASEAAHN